METGTSKRPNRIVATACAAWVLSMSALIQAQPEAQTLSLFEAVEQSAGNDQGQTTGPRTPSVSVGSGPQFSLVGTSRFGNRYRVSVRDSSGDVITVDAGEGGNAAIPGYPGFTVTQVASRHVLLQHPGNIPCFAFRDQGVTCEADNTARLALATAEPVAPPPEPERRRDRQAEDRDADTREQDAEERPENPFAAALRAARERGEPDAAASRAEEQRFRPRRIDPADVPEGYRLIRTPFGDRVVPR